MNNDHLGNEPFQWESISDVSKLVRMHGLVITSYGYMYTRGRQQSVKDKYL